MEEDRPLSEEDRRTIDFVLSLNEKSSNGEVLFMPSFFPEDKGRSWEADNEVISVVDGEEFGEEVGEVGETNEVNEVNEELNDELNSAFCRSELIGRAKKVASPLPAKKSSSA